ncbi:MAG: fibronectin type III domain-containing protein [Phycisphaerales bacterium]|nr:fibronectin type III domain-containing protein [Phycisphaerales bacterium]
MCRTTKRYLLYFVVFLLILSKKSNAQYPVTVSTQVLPPFSTVLSNYYSTRKLIVILTALDFQKPELMVRLRMSIQGSAIKLSSVNDQVSPILTIRFGVPFEVSMNDLSYYFNPDHLQFVGISKEQYQRQGYLPEGYYQLCFEVLDAQSGRVISFPNCASVYLSLSEPPILNTPENSDNIAYSNPNYILFNWTPRHLNTSISFATTQYRFQITEVWDNQIDPAIAFQNTSPFFQTITNTTTYIYGPQAPPLLPGKKYAWRVQVLAHETTQQPTVFRNDGYSPVFSFTYQDDCPVPDQDIVLIENGKVVIAWEPNIKIQRYTIKYRERYNTNAQWFTQSINTSEHQVTLWDIKPATVYDYQLGGLCVSNQDPVYGIVKSFETPVEETNNAYCGLLPNLNLSNVSLLDSLHVHDHFYTGDFPIEVTQIDKQRRPFTGQGFVIIPFLAKTKIKVHFNDIDINKDKQLVHGTIETAYQSNEQTIIDLDKIVEGGATIGFPKQGLSTVDYPVDFIIKEPQKKVTIKPDTAHNNGELLLPDNNKVVVVITDKEGNAREVALDSLPTTIQDKEGDQFIIDHQGNMTKVGAHEPLVIKPENMNHLNEDMAVVQFEATDPYKLNFDQWITTYQKSSLWNDQYELLNGNYHVSACCVAKGKIDTVIATITIRDNNFDPSKIKFITKKENLFVSKYLGNNKFQVYIIGGKDNDAQELYAVYKKGNQTNLLGKLLIVSYQEKTVPLTIIPVNGNKIDKQSLEETLKKIYEPIQIKFKVDEAPSFDYSLAKEKFAVKPSKAFTTYSSDMKAINDAYALTHQIEKDRLYLFILEKPTDESVIGDMPRGSQFGYIFTKGHLPTRLNTIIAHEVGHGRFHLKHTFDKQYGFNETDLIDNLMNYQDGQKLNKLQWNAMHEPGLVLNAYKPNKDSKYETDGHYSTVYLVALMLGMNPEQALQLAIATESPDTDVHGQMDFRINDTWANGYDQKTTHALTDGFHGVEELVTALQFMYTNEQDIPELGRLLHRFGDTYAHTRIGNTTEEQWQHENRPDIAPKIEQWLNYINEDIHQNGLQFLIDSNLQKKFLNQQTLPEYLYHIYGNTITDKFRMYGSPFLHTLGIQYTIDHAASDQAEPDYIYIRPNWYLSYVKNLAALIAYKFHRNGNQLVINTFERMINFASLYHCSLKGIIDYEIATLLHNNYVIIPIMNNLNQRFFGGLDLMLTDYEKVAKEASTNLQKYLVEFMKTPANKITTKPITIDAKTVGYLVNF